VLPQAHLQYIRLLPISQPYFRKKSNRGIVMSIKNRIKDLADSHHQSIAEVERHLSFGNGTIAKWDTRSPSSEKLQKVADYFDVSTDYLLGRDAKENKTADLADKDTVFTYEGREIPAEDLEYMKRLLRGGK